MTSNRTFSFRSVLLLAALSGFIALSWEIVWARLYNVASESRAVAFGAMLGSYLLGLAGGSLASMRWQKSDHDHSLRHLSQLILGANLAAFVVVPLVSWMVVFLPEKMWLWNGWEIQAWLWTLPLVAVAAALQGTVLPLLSHVAIPADRRAGVRLSYVYLANIIGSALGSLLTGFILMDIFTLGRLSGVLLFLGVVLAALARWSSGSPILQGIGPRPGLTRPTRLLMNGWSERPGLIAFGVLALVVISWPDLVFGGLWERLQYKRHYHSGMRFAKVVESKHGVVSIDSKNTVYGNGAYDGVISTTLEPGDWHVRPYFLSAVHPDPQEVLVIGVSAGAWTQILANHPQVKTIDAVEISHAYLDVIAYFPEVSGILKDPKVKIHIDDGRRWLKRNPERRFDAILMNTTHHWREFASALLSKEFLELAKAHLKPDGIVMWNCTQSKRAMKTGLEVFPHTMMCLNNCVGSLSPLKPDRERWKSILTRYTNSGKPLFDLDQEKGRSDLEGVLRLLDNEGTNDSFHQWWHSNRARMEAECANEIPITDDNLGHEYP